MAKVAHEPVKRAMSRIRELSADAEARRLAFVRERALRDEVSLLNEAKREGEQLGLEKGEHRRTEQIACNLIARTEMGDAMIAEIAVLPTDEVARLRDEAQN